MGRGDDAWISASFFFIFFICSVSFAQLPIPSKYDGFVYGRSSGDSSAIMVEAFLDPMCPDSRDSWPPLKQAVEYYSPRLALIVHSFPLPYHSNSFLSCRALHIANKLNSSSTYPLLELFFDQQEKYYNAPTYNMSRESIVDEFSKIASLAVGSNSLSAILSGYDDPQTDATARISFKYGCTRGVAGTPYFFVNGMPLPDGGSVLGFQKWRNIIDPLVG